VAALPHLSERRARDAHRDLHRLPHRPATKNVAASAVECRVSASGVITVAGQPISLGRAQAGAVVTVHVSDTTLRTFVAST
jgi:hypothetical protein